MDFVPIEKGISCVFKFLTARTAITLAVLQSSRTEEHTSHFSTKTISRTIFIKTGSTVIASVSRNLALRTDWCVDRRPFRQAAL